MVGVVGGLLRLDADLDSDTWASVFNNGLTLSIVLLSVTLITGHGRAAFACARRRSPASVPSRSAQLANHLGSELADRAPGRCRVGRRRGAVILALLSLRLRGLGLALMTLAAALLFDATFFNESSITGGRTGYQLQAKWLGTSAFFNFNGHAIFLLSLGVLTVCVFLVLLVRKGTVGRNLAAMRGSETAYGGPRGQPRPGSASWSSRCPVRSPAWAACSYSIVQQQASPTRLELPVLARLRRAGRHDRA